MSNESIGRTAAEKFRNTYALGVTPIPNLARLIEHNVGIGVAYVRSSARGHGMTMLLDGTYLMAVGCTEHPMRLRSTLAHELGHHQLDTVDRMAGSAGWANRSPEEIQADAFARHLLVPLGAVEEIVDGSKVTLATLSDIVQVYLASPKIVAIQMRDAGAIDADTCDKWGQIPAGTIAARFGWHQEYQALVEQSKTPRSPQRLMMRVMEGYRQGSVSPAVVAKLIGANRATDVKADLAEDGITPAEARVASAPPPEDTGERLTPQELAALTGGTD